MLLLSACGGGSSTGADSTPASWSVSGNWQMSLFKDGKTSSKPRTQTGFLVASQNNVSGGAIFSSADCSGSTSVSGNVDGNDVVLTTDPTGLSVQLNGKLGSDKASMSGNYTLLAEGCGASETGTWTAILIKALNGTFAGTTDDGKYAISAGLTQAANDGGSSADITGSLTISGSPCFPNGATATVSGLVSGQSVLLNFADSNGNQMGQISGNSPADGSATSIAGNYRLIGQGLPSCNTNGSSGTVTLSLGSQ